MVDTSKIINMISNQVANIVNENLEFYRDFRFKVQEERVFLNDESEDEHKTIYIVVKFLTADIFYNQVSLPITVECISESEGFEVARTLLYTFTERFNLKWNDDKTIEQVWETPSINENYLEVYEGFRSLILFPGAVLITDNGNTCTVQYSPSTTLKQNTLKYYKKENNVYVERTTSYNPSMNMETFEKYLKDNEYGITLTKNDKFYLKNNPNNGIWELYKGEFDAGTKKSSGNFSVISNLYSCGVELNISDPELYKEGINDIITFEIDEGYADLWYLAVTTHATISLDSQAFYNNKGFTKSVAKFGSFSMNLSTYLFDNAFSNKCLDVYFGDIVNQPMGINTDFNFKITFRNGKTYLKTLKLADFSLTGERGKLLMVSLTFSE